MGAEVIIIAVTMLLEKELASHFTQCPPSHSRIRAAGGLETLCAPPSGKKKTREWSLCVYLCLREEGAQGHTHLSGEKGSVRDGQRFCSCEFPTHNCYVLIMHWRWAG